MKIMPISFRSNNIQSQQLPMTQANISHSGPTDTAKQMDKEKIFKIGAIVTGVGLLTLAIVKHKDISRLFRGNQDNIIGNLTTNPQRVENIVENLPTVSQPVNDIAANSSAPLEQITNQVEEDAAIIPKLVNKLVQNQPLIPEYLYHMTSKENYESMLRDGQVNVSAFEGSVFLSDIKSLVGKYSDVDSKRMIKWYGGLFKEDYAPKSASKTVVLLKIPTASLDKNSVFVRKIGLVNQEEFENEFLTQKKNLYEVSEEEMDGVKSNPLEYLHDGSIPISKFSLINSVKIDELSDNTFVSKFFKLMFDNAPEKEFLI